MEDNKESQIIEFLKVQPRSKREIEAKFLTDIKQRTLDYTLSALLRQGKIVRGRVNRDVVYSVCDDERLHLLLEIMNIYDSKKTRIFEITSNFGNIKVGNVVENDDEITGNVSSFSNEAITYSVKLTNYGEYFCNCFAHRRYDVPCKHVSILAYLYDKLEWLKIAAKLVDKKVEENG